MTWGGLRDGISLAMALSLPNEVSRTLFITITYVIVVFSFLAQGLTIEYLVKKLKLTNKQNKEL